MSKVLAITLGILTAIGGFVDIGDLVANALVGARFGMSLAWVVLVGIVGICLYAEMSGRIAAVSGRAVFDLVRERLGPRVGLLNLAASYLVNLMTLAAEVAGVALALQLLTSVSYLLFVPASAFLVWIVIWRMPFEQMERLFGLAGLSLLVFAVALWKLGPDWSSLWGQARSAAPPPGESWTSYSYYVVALFGAAMTPYEVFFFSSGGVEEKWTAKSLSTMRLNVFVGFPLGGALSLSIAAVTAVVFLPVGVQVNSLAQVPIPVAVALGKVGVAVALLGFFAATFGAACETG